MASESLMQLERSNSQWGPQIYPIKMVIPVATFFLLLQGLATFIRDLITATTGKKPS